MEGLLGVDNRYADGDPRRLSDSMPSVYVNGVMQSIHSANSAFFAEDATIVISRSTSVGYKPLLVQVVLAVHFQGARWESDEVEGMYPFTPLLRYPNRERWASASAHAFRHLAQLENVLASAWAATGAAPAP